MLKYYIIVLRWNKPTKERNTPSYFRNRRGIGKGNLLGRTYTIEDKSIYQISREELHLSRAAAVELLETASSSRLEKIEYEETTPYPDEVLAMETAYKKPELCNYYCSHECPIGKKYVPEVKMKDLSQITLEILASLIAMEKEKNRLVEITVDGNISSEETADFQKIQAHLSEISLAIDSLQLWLQKAIADGKVK